MTVCSTSTDRCIDCTTCANFAPDIFARDTKIWKNYVHSQPNGEDLEQLERARAALVACPVSAIRLDTTTASNTCTGSASADAATTSTYVKKLVPTRTEFPRLMMQVPATKGEVWYAGHHSADTFGATPYIARGSDGTTVLVDTPRFSIDSARAIESICGSSTGPNYHLITHVDDSAGHLEWKERYGNMKRIFHCGDLGEHNWRRDVSLEDVEILLEERSQLNDDGTFTLQAWTLDGKDLTSSSLSDCEKQNFPEFVVYHTPGHSPGSISLLFQQDVLFTGDTLAYSSREEGMVKCCFSIFEYSLGGSFFSHSVTINLNLRSNEWFSEIWKRFEPTISNTQCVSGFTMESDRAWPWF